MKKVNLVLLIFFIISSINPVWASSKLSNGDLEEAFTKYKKVLETLSYAIGFLQIDSASYASVSSYRAFYRLPRKEQVNVILRYANNFRSVCRLFMIRLQSLPPKEDKEDLQGSFKRDRNFFIDEQEAIGLTFSEEWDVYDFIMNSNYFEGVRLFYVIYFENFFSNNEAKLDNIFMDHNYDDDSPLAPLLFYLYRIYFTHFSVPMSFIKESPLSSSLEELCSPRALSPYFSFFLKGIENQGRLWELSGRDINIYNQLLITPNNDDETENAEGEDISSETDSPEGDNGTPMEETDSSTPPVDDTDNG